jgi:hypothetical protein
MWGRDDRNISTAMSRIPPALMRLHVPARALSDSERSGLATKRQAAQSILIREIDAIRATRLRVDWE